ncbi:hypothetical protein Tb927.8.3030 [Trypanosoma brucei brucei TREU927]|uniref:T. brucei spp.-specific protein n=1 Tax=Trypanosoma brucei brucei (strain 927/4 GUTat10.1) TaxID=185431 RepID=Q57W70_TRYB2|nr:hypothetical protein Tb927.8.3030 [Trypanosoma brucei brucei TREU927]AAX70149.1 hypothetical protein Tb927.8.3030 [Trypanosoma brucei]AAZ13068.1 hypothetical protein Tb927.8.3030 [Trypanosoma brucei brucei TREU927]
MFSKYGGRVSIAHSLPFFYLSYDHCVLPSFHPNAQLGAKEEEETLARISPLRMSAIYIYIYIYICLFACFFVPSSNFCFPHHAHVFFFPFSLFLAICPLTVLEAVRTSNEEKFSAGDKTKASTTQQYVSVYVFSRICVLTYCSTPIQLMHLFPVFLYSLCCIAVKFTLTMPAVMIFFFFSPLLSSSSSPFLSLVFAVASFLTAMRITILYRPHGHALTLPPLLLQMSPADTPVSP